MRLQARGRRELRPELLPVDGECSTNDAVFLLSSGASGIVRTPATDVAFGLALARVCDAVAQQIVADGEGATVLAEIAVRGAVDGAPARAIAARIATSPLVKTALFGHDANWGRVLAAAGSAPFDGGFVHLDPGLVRRFSQRHSGIIQHAAASVEAGDVATSSSSSRSDTGRPAISRATSRTTTCGSSARVPVMRSRRSAGRTVAGPSAQAGGCSRAADDVVVIAAQGRRSQPRRWCAWHPRSSSCVDTA